eukprot:s1377_g17.t1
MDCMNCKQQKLHDKWALENNLLVISIDFFGSKRQLLLAEQVEDFTKRLLLKLENKLILVRNLTNSDNFSSSFHFML